MYRLVETVKLSNGILHDIEYHNERFNRSRKELFNIDGNLDLTEHINPSQEQMRGIFKCRILYSPQITAVQILPYDKRNPASLRLIYDDLIEYPYKFENRNFLDRLLLKKGDADDIIIVKNGLLTDTSFSNIALYNGSEWITPSSPILKGARREKLIRTGKILESRIKPSDLKKFIKISMINTMIDLDELNLPLDKVID